jgi:hypothetical protein
VSRKWGTRIEAVNFYSERFGTVKSTVVNFPSESAVSVHEPESAFSDPKVVCSIACIRSNLDWLPENIKHLETQRLSLQESVDIMKSASEKGGW